MRLYKMELYKLCHRKIFVIGAGCTIGLLLLYFRIKVSDDKSVFTDGWDTFFDVLELGLIIGSILILFSVSIVFANEGQTKMLPLLFTTKEGKGKDISIKIAAAYTIAVSVWLGIVSIDFLLCGIVYGFDGLECMVGTTSVFPHIDISVYRPVTMLPVGTYMIIVLFRSFLGILLLCSITIYISARFRSCFYAVVNAALCWLSPVLIWILLGWIPTGAAAVRMIRLIMIWLVYATPIYLTMYNSIMDCYRSWVKLAGVSAAGIIFCTAGAYRRYKRLIGKETK